MAFCWYHVEQEKLDLNAPISKYLPEFPSRHERSVSGDLNSPATTVPSPTVRDLLRQTAGFTYGIYADAAVDRSYRASGILSRTDSNQVFVGKLSKIPLLYKPATKFHYGVSVDVLGRLVEVASGLSLDAYFEKFIFGPLEMRDSGFYVPADKTARFVDNFGSASNGGLRIIDQAMTSQFLSKPSFISGGGGLAVVVLSQIMPFTFQCETTVKPLIYNAVD